MCLTEFDEKKYEDVLREEGREEGLAKGRKKGGIIRMCEQVAASGNTLILYSA